VESVIGAAEHWSSTSFLSRKGGVLFVLFTEGVTLIKHFHLYAGRDCACSELLFFFLRSTTIGQALE